MPQTVKSQTELLRQDNANNVPAICDEYGAQYVSQWHIQAFQSFVTLSGATTAATLVSAATTTGNIYLSNIVFSANTIATLNLYDGTTTGEIYRLICPANDTVSISLPVPTQLTTNYPLKYTTNVTVTSLMVSGYNF